MWTRHKEFASAAPRPGPRVLHVVTIGNKLVDSPTMPCPYKFGGTHCGYSPAAQRAACRPVHIDCDHTLEACRERHNEQRYGGYIVPPVPLTSKEL